MTFRAGSDFRFILLATILIAASCNDKNNGADKAAGNKPKVLTAQGFVTTMTDYAPVYAASGALLPNESIDIHPEVNGRVTGIFFREGNQVRKGQLLLQLNDADIVAQIQKLRAQRSLQQTTQGRQEALLKIGGISRQEYDATTTDIKSLEADIAISQASLARLKIVAPFDGTIGLRNVSLGAIVSPATIVASLQQVSPLKMDFAIPDQYRSQLALNQTVHFTVDGSLDTMEGKIAAIDPGADAVTHTVRARAIVNNAAGKLVPGSFAHVTIPFGASGKTIMIPSQAVIPTTRDKKVAVVRNGKAELVTVVTGDRTADQVQILSGLNVGDTLMTTALMQVKPGLEVQVRFGKPAAARDTAATGAAARN
jgi:membrane fusion protein (multidrug efflux system)